MSAELTIVPSQQAAPQPSLGQAQFRLHPRAAWRSVGGELFVITEDRAFHRVAAPTAVDLVRRLAQSAATPAELADQLVRDYQVDAATAQRDVATFVDALLHKHIAIAVQAIAVTPSPHPAT